ncbi:hypothetical protein BJ085DRAFT_40671 [Dimargaris cristalligena]|uniref:Uncharacterized protein n=1 Tax=Dimargaris cristalligena TaxID=215637 RepID=A0A4P9ZT22_9FUNG|nr:hypothetical protein BJ085DRAFT_40671 [Dimargaris cristalligena]|eukprot:RKP36348.1 hypothetical protein BJ085DRAFT_40671 [Dimargaris cristalligena]
MPPNRGFVPSQSITGHHQSHMSIGSTNSGFMGQASQNELYNTFGPQGGNTMHPDDESAIFTHRSPGDDSLYDQPASLSSANIMSAARVTLGQQEFTVGTAQVRHPGSYLDALIEEDASPNGYSGAENGPVNDIDFDQFRKQHSAQRKTLMVMRDQHGRNNRNSLLYVGTAPAAIIEQERSLLDSFPDLTSEQFDVNGGGANDSFDIPGFPRSK